jgi:hypothetical protein
MIEEVVISIKELISYREHCNEQYMQKLEMLSSGYVEIYIPATKCRKCPSKEQNAFIKHVLPVMIQNRIPLFNEVLALYGLNETSCFYYENASWDPCGYFDEDLQESKKI